MRAQPLVAAGQGIAGGIGSLPTSFTMMRISDSRSSIQLHPSIGEYNENTIELIALWLCLSAVSSVYGQLSTKLRLAT